MPPCQDRVSRVLLVEGNTDCHVVLAFRQLYGLNDRFGVFSCGSDEKAISTLNALILTAGPPKPEIIGLVIDADTGRLHNRWAQIRNRLLSHGYNCPHEPNAAGTLIEAPQGLPKLGIWLMPDNQREGMLEDFLLSTLDLRSVLACKTALAIGKAAKVAKYKRAHASKALIHTYLAWQDEPGRPLGISVTARVLRPDTPLAEAFGAWLAMLFPAV